MTSSLKTAGTRVGLAGMLALVLARPASAGPSVLTDREQRIAAAASAEYEHALTLLETLVNINSGTMNFSGVERVGRIVMGELESLGSTVHWKPMTAVGRAGLVVAEHHGSGAGQRLLLIGHLDTVFEQDSPFQHFERRGDMAEGPGVNGMKDGLAIMVGALRALDRAEALKDADVTIVLSGDEEATGSPLALNADAAGGVASGKTNVIPAQGLARGDLRTLSNEQTARLTAKMRAIVAEHLPGTDAAIEFAEGYPAMAPSVGNRALLSRLNEINEALGLQPMAELDPLKRGAGDISFVTDRVAGLVDFGALGAGSHAPGETVDLSSFDRQLKRTALLIGRLSRERRP